MQTSNLTAQQIERYVDQAEELRNQFNNILKQAEEQELQILEDEAEDLKNQFSDLILLYNKLEPVQPRELRNIAEIKNSLSEVIENMSQINDEYAVIQNAITLQEQENYKKWVKEQGEQISSKIKTLKNEGNKKRKGQSKTQEKSNHIVELLHGVEDKLEIIKQHIEGPLSIFLNHDTLIELQDLISNLADNPDNSQLQSDLESKFISFESLNETLDEKEKEFNQREQDFENQLYNQGSANIQVMTQQQYAQNQKLFGHNNSDSNEYQQQQQDMQQEQQEQLKQEQQKQEEQEQNNRQQQKLKQQQEKEKEKEREKQQKEKEKQRQKEIQQQQQKKEEQTQQMQQKQQEQIKVKQQQNQQQNQNSNQNYQQQQQQNQKNQQPENNGNEQKKQIPQQQQQQSSQQQQLQQQNNGHYNQQQQQQQQQNSISSTQKKKQMTPQQIQQQQQYCQSLQRDQTLGYYIKMMKLSNETQAKSADYFPSSLMKEKISIKSHFPKHRMLNEKVFKLLDLETLFFIFYLQKNTYEQYLAAKELKIREWRFHTKFSTWFKRMENPKQQNKDLEIGNYIFFDFEKAWQQRKKTEFQFKYQYYEREEL